MQRRTLAICAGLIAAILNSRLAAGQGEPQRQHPPGSIQAWLERLRLERDASHASLSTRIAELSAELEALSSEPVERKVEAARNSLRALGPEALPLLVPLIDPGLAAEAAAKFRAREVATVLALEHPLGLAQELLALVKGGSRTGRGNALLVLRAHGDAARVVPGLIAIYQGAEESDRAELLAVLATLGGAQVERLLADTLNSESSALVAAALDALIATKSLANAPAILLFLSTPQASAHSERIIAYYQATPAAMNATHAATLLALAGSNALSEKARARLIESLTPYELKLESAIEGPLQNFADGGTREVRESSLVVLSVFGDRSARKNLLKPYEETIKKSPKWSQAYVQLGDVLTRIRDYKKAIPEYKTALELQSKDERVDEMPFLGIARCHACLGDFKEAADYLEKAPLSLKSLRELARDPDFAAMAANPRYNKVFHLEQDS